MSSAIDLRRVVATAMGLNLARILRLLMLHSLAALLALFRAKSPGPPRKRRSCLVRHLQVARSCPPTALLPPMSHRARHAPFLLELLEVPVVPKGKTPSWLRS